MKLVRIAIVLSILLVSACALWERLRPLRPLKTIYIVPILGHLDYGFTASQREVKALWPDIYRKGVRFLENHPKAILTSGSLLPVEWFHDKATPEEWRRFQRLVKSGRWELTAGLLHTNTSVLSEAETSRLFFDSRRWAEKFEVPIFSWLHADVPGLTWNMAEAASNARIKFIAVGANEMGGMSPLPERLPPLFFWEAPDGKRVAVSVRGGSGYMEGGLDLALHEEEGLRERLKEYVKSLRAKGYLLDKSIVLFSSGDNNGPDAFPALMKTVEQWNSQGFKTRLRIAALSGFYRELTEEERALLPVVKGDWPASGHWEALVRRTPHAEAAARSAKRELLAAELLSVILDRRNDADNLRASWRNLLLYDEHSGVGAWPNKLTRKQLIEQNRTEHALANEALKGAESSIYKMAFSREIRLLLPPFKPLLVCNVSDAKNGGILKWLGQKDTSPQQGVVFFNGDIPAWSCSISPNSKAELRRPLKGKHKLPVRIEKTVRLEPPLFLRSGVMKIEQAANPPLVKEVFQLSKNAYAVRLRWGPVSKLPAAKNMRGWAATFSFGLPIESFNWVRGGLAFSQKKTLSYLSWRMPWEGVLAQLEGGGRVMLSNIEGSPVYSAVPSRPDALWWLLYVQESPVTFRGGKTGLAPHEPDAFNKPLQSLWVVKRSSSSGGSDLAALRDMSTPIIGFAYREGVAGDAAIVKSEEVVLRSFSTASPEISIEEVKWADFEKGIVVRLRNLTTRAVTTNVVSHLGTIEKAVLVDGLERFIRNIAHGSGWIKISLNPLEVVRLRLHIVRQRRVDEY